MNWIEGYKKKLIFIVIICILLLISKYYYFWLIIPFVLGILLFYSIKFYTQRLFLVYPVIILGTLCMIYFVGEFYFILSTQLAKYNSEELQKYSRDKENLEFSPYGSNWNNKDNITGYGPTEKNSKTQSRKLFNGQTVYDVIYTTDYKGRRITPQNENTADTLILLFGCSFTFGEGLNDEETYAWKLSHLLGAKYQIYNYGFHGFGSHQMLSLFQSNRLDYLNKKYNNVHIFYLTFKGIELRCAGHSKWDKQGPMYVADNNHSVKRVGTFNDFKPKALRGKFKQSLFAEYLLKIYNHIMSPFETDPYKMCALDAAIIKEAEKISKEKFPYSTFTVVMYDKMPQTFEILNDYKIDILEFNDTFVGSDKDTYKIPLDGHPNALATDIIAEKYFQYILKLDTLLFD